MPSSKKNTIDPKKFALYEKLIASAEHIELKGAANPYTSHKGHMFSFLRQDGVMGLRLAPNDREAFLKKYNTKLIENYGIVLKEYVEVPDALLSKTSSLKAYLLKSYEYIDSLKAKPTTKSKKKE